MRHANGIPTGVARRILHIAVAVVLVTLAPRTSATTPQGDLRGVPVRSFGPSEYGAHPQCWSMVQDPRGLIHVANTDGLLTFDGARWTRWAMENDASVTSVCVGPDGNVYVGATGHMARLVADEHGNLEFEVLGAELAPEDRPLGDVWFAVSSDDEVFMCSLTQIYRVRTDGSVERIDTAAGLALDGRYFAPEAWRGALWIVIDGSGLHRWNGEVFEEVVLRDPAADPYDTSLPFSQRNLSDVCVTEDYFVIIETDRLFRYDGDEVTRFETTSDSLLAQAWPYAGTGLSDGSVAIGTVEAGAFVFAADGRTRGHWTGSHGLLHDTVSDLGSDAEGGLWICQENGIVRLDLTAPFEIFPEVTGLISDAVEFEGYTYVTTSHGFYRLDDSDSRHRRFEILEKGDDFTGMVRTESDLFVVSSSGIRGWNGQAFDRRRLSLNYPSSTLASRHFADILFSNSRDGLVAISTKSDSLAELSKTPLPIEGHTLLESSPGELWVGSREGVVVRVNLGLDDLNSTSIRVYGAEDGVPPTHCAVAEFAGVPYLGTGRGLFRLSDDRFEELPAAKSPSPRIGAIRADVERLWVLLDGNVGVVRFGLDPDGSWGIERASSLHERSGRIFSFCADGSTLWASQANRLVRWDERSQPEDIQDFTPVLRRIVVAGDSTLWSGTGSPGSVRIDSRHGSLRFEFAALTQRGEAAPTYQSKLEGYDSDWSGWSATPFREYANLRDGGYRLQVRAMDAYGIVSGELSLPVEVEAPWSRSGWGRILTLLLLVSGVALLSLSIVAFRSRQIDAQKRALMSMVEARTEELALANLDLQDSNAELEHLNCELRRVASQRSELLGIAAHDLKNPIASIRMVAGTLALDLGPESEGGQLLSIIDEASERMLERIQGLLSSAASEAGEMTIDIHECDAVELSRDVIQLQLQAARAKKQTLRLHVDADTQEIWIEGDRGRLHQAFENLISNAIKYSPAGAKIDAIISTVDDELVRVQVRDQGPGLDEMDRDKLFKPFQRLAPRPTANEESCGLGLFIVKSVVERHGGRVWVESTLGEGSVFGFDLPCSRRTTGNRRKPLALG